MGDPVHDKIETLYSGWPRRMEGPRRRAAIPGVNSRLHPAAAYLGPLRSRNWPSRSPQVGLSECADSAAKVGRMDQQRNVRSEAGSILNLHCRVNAGDESMLRAPEHRILLQHYLPISDLAQQKLRPDLNLSQH